MYNLIHTIEEKRISIITVTYNCVSDIEATIKSIIFHPYRSLFQYIVIDGNSTDGTKDIIDKYGNEIDYWISEPDKGIYDAMNKGIQKSSCEYIYHINSGDLLYNIDFSTIPSNFDLVLFNVKLSDGKIYYSKFNYKLKLRNSVHHQGVLYQRNLFLNDLYNSDDYRIFADFDFNQKLYINNKKLKIFYANQVLCFHSLEGVSHDKKKSKEIFQVTKNNIGIFWMGISYLYFKYCGLKKRLGL